MTSKEKTIEIYTDGACSGNPGPGGWGAILLFGDKKKEISGGKKDTTNNQMELMAAIKALSAVKKKHLKINLHTDSKYVLDGITGWIHGWKKKSWKTAGNKPVKNKELWQALDKLNQKLNVKWHWVKGHNDHIFNDRADELARKGIGS